MGETILETDPKYVAVIVRQKYSTCPRRFIFRDANNFGLRRMNRAHGSFDKGLLDWRMIVLGVCQTNDPPSSQGSGQGACKDRRFPCHTAHREQVGNAINSPGLWLVCL